MSDVQRWRGKVALVTGASSAGIGRATAKRLAALGMKVVLTGRDGSRLEALREEIRAEIPDAAGEAMVARADFRKEAEILEVFAQVRSQWGGVDVLINNAGLGYARPLAEQPPEDWREMLDVNVVALAICMQETLKDLAGKPEGQIINISSIAGHRVPPMTANAFYAASKHAVKALTDAIRMDLVAASSPVRIGMISPGMVETEFSGRARRDPAGPSAYKRFKPLDAEDVADVVCYMLGTPPHVNIHDVIMRSVEQPH